MEKYFKLIKDFEHRNNLSVYVTFYGDGSCSLHEFWQEELLSEFENFQELEDYLLTINYEKSGNGLCLSPVVIASDSSQ